MFYAVAQFLRDFGSVAPKRERAPRADFDKLCQTDSLTELLRSTGFCAENSQIPKAQQHVGNCLLSNRACHNLHLLFSPVYM